MEGLASVLIKAAAFIVIIGLGYLLKRRRFFQPGDFYLLSRIVICITLPAAIVANFSQAVVEPSMILICVAGLVSNMILVGAGYLIYAGKSGTQKAFGMLNTSGYNIGNFTMPFVQSFLGPAGFAAASLFDAGNAVMCTGLTYSAAAVVQGQEQTVNRKKVIKKLFSSVPFNTYIIMTILTLSKIKLPLLVTDFAATVGSANAFLALLMLGIGFDVRRGRDKLAEIIKIITVRYGIAILMAAAFYNFLPFSLEIRQALAIIAFGPVSSVSPAFTGQLNGDVELASTVNSISILVSIGAIVLAFAVFL